MLLLFAAPVAAQEEQRAGLVIIHGDGSVTTQCVAFTEESLTGAELLTRSGLELAVEASSMGGTICQIDGEGCDFPAESCFCQCQGSPCVYWSYWRWQDGAWQYSNAGAGNTTVRDGAVEGWRWGLGTVDKAEPPPVVTFADICGAGAAPVEGSPPTSLATATTVPLLTRLPANDVRPPAPAEPPASPPVTVLTPRTALTVLLGVLVALPLAAFLIAWGWRSGQRKQP